MFEVMLFVVDEQNRTVDVRGRPGVVGYYMQEALCQQHCLNLRAEGRKVRIVQIAARHLNSAGRPIPEQHCLLYQGNPALSQIV